MAVALVDDGGGHEKGRQEEEGYNIRGKKELVGLSTSQNQRVFALKAAFSAWNATSLRASYPECDKKA